MSFWTLTWLLCGSATIYPYYRFAIKPAARRGDKETSWRELDPVFFPLVTIAVWPIALMTVALALYVRRLRRLTAAGHDPWLYR